MRNIAIIPKTFKLILSILIILINITIINTNKKLRFSFELFRHGARSPIVLSNEKRDIFNNQWEEIGELTSVGKRQHFLLGHRNKKTFGEKRLNIEKFNSQEIFIRSTVLNRTIESAYSHLTGFFPPGTGEVLTENQIKNAYPPFNNFNFSEEVKNLENFALPQNSNVFPIDNILKTEKFSYVHDKDTCKGVKELYNNRDNFPEFLDFKKNFQEKYLAKIYKIINKTSDEYNLDEYDKCHDLYDAFICGYFDSRKFDEILNNEMTIKEFKSLADKFLYVDTFYGSVPGEKIGLIGKSHFLRSLLGKMKNRIKIDSINNFTNLYITSDQKIYMISGDGTDIRALMFFMKHVFKTELIYPEFATSLYF